ncbi:MAG: universal stress protein [Methylophilaceae bacterium]
MMYKKILCPVDGSDTSNRGMQEAIKLAKDQQAKLKFIHVVDAYFPLIDGVGNFIPVDVTEVLHENAKAIIEKAKKTANDAGLVVEVEVLKSRGGRPSTTIIDCAASWQADIIVMGTHGLCGISRIVMGSDAENVLRTSAVPVLLINMLGNANN